MSPTKKKTNEVSEKPAYYKSSTQARFDTRLSITQKSMFEEAARIGGYKTLSEFIIQVTMEAATHIIEKHKALLVSSKDQRVFFDALTNPPKPNKALTQAAKDYKKRIVAK